jgi:hypothetical protein
MRIIEVQLCPACPPDHSAGRRARTGSGRRPLYTAELWSRSLTPSQSEARLSQAELRLASTTAARGHSWRGEARPQFQLEKKFLFAVSTFLEQRGDFFGFFLFMYDIQQRFICRPSDSTVSEDAGIEPKTVATTAVRRSNHSARSHPQNLAPMAL